MLTKLLSKKDTAEIIHRNCVCCGAKIEVTLFKDGAYENGHYFGKSKELGEYWECEKCYREAEKEAKNETF